MIFVKLKYYVSIIFRLFPHYTDSKNYNTMKKTTLLIGCMMLFFAAFSQKKYADNIGYIAALKGVPLRQSPDAKAEKITTIASEKSVKILGEPLELDGRTHGEK